MLMKRKLLFASAVTLLVLGGIAFYAGLKPFGLLAILASVSFVRIANTRGTSTVGVNKAPLAISSGPSRLLRIVSAVMVPVAIGAFLWLQYDAAHGYHQTAPVIAFAIVAAVCCVAWSLLVAESR